MDTNALWRRRVTNEGRTEGKGRGGGGMVCAEEPVFGFDDGTTAKAAKADKSF